MSNSNYNSSRRGTDEQRRQSFLTLLSSVKSYGNLSNITDEEFFPYAPRTSPKCARNEALGQFSLIQNYEVPKLVVISEEAPDEDGTNHKRSLIANFL